MDYHIFIGQSIIELVKFTLLYGVYWLAKYYSRHYFEGDDKIDWLDLLIAFTKAIFFIVIICFSIFYFKNEDKERMLNLTDTLTYCLVLSTICFAGLYFGYPKVKKTKNNKPDA